MKLYLQIIFLLFSSLACQSTDDLPAVLDSKLELMKTQLTAVYKIKKIMYIPGGVNTIPDLKSNKVICLSYYLYEARDVELTEKQVEELDVLIKHGIGDENFRRDKDVDSHFTGDHLFVFSPGLLSGYSKGIYVTLKEDEPHLVNIGYQIYNFNQETFQKVKSYID